MKPKPIPKRESKMTKEQFMIQWVLARASFREDFSGVAAVLAAQEAWNKIQALK